MELLAELEKAAAVLVSSESTVSSEIQKRAEDTVLQFRKSKHPYANCQFILENSKVDYVLFEAASTIKEAILREWHILQKPDIDNICSFLLMYVTKDKSLQGFVREQILQVVAIIIKRGSLDGSQEFRENLLNTIDHCINNGDKEMLLICCSIMKALLTEYSSTRQSSNVGLSLEFHAKCKKTFEEQDLLRIFLFTIKILRQFMNVPLASLARVDTAIFVRYLSLAEQTLCWNFGPTNTLMQVSSETATVILFKPSNKWKDSILDPGLPELFFNLLGTALQQEELTHHCLQCLVQLASVSGPLVSTSEQKRMYLSNFLLKGFLHFLGRIRWTGMEALGAANIVARLVNVFPASNFAELASDQCREFTAGLAERTIQFEELSALAENESLEDNKYQEALDTILCSWVILVSKPQLFGDDYFMRHAVNIYNSYLKTHLAAPEGSRSPKSQENEKEIDFEIEDDDRVTHADELDNIGVLGRQALSHTLAVLYDLLASRLGALQSYLQKVEQHGTGREFHDADSLFEDIHWLLLTSSHTLMLHGPGETPTVPEEIVKYGVYEYQSGRINIDASVEYLLHFGIGVSDEGVDKLVRLVATILRLAKMEITALQSGLFMAFSPEVASSLLSFLQRWITTYLLPETTTQPETNSVLTAVFGTPNGPVKELIGSLLELSETNFMKWSSEPTVAEDAVQLLLQLVKSKSRCSIALTYPHVWRVANEFVGHKASIKALPPDVLKHLVQALVTAGSTVAEKETRHRFFSQFLAPLKERYTSITHREDFHKVAQNESVKQEVSTTLDSMRGVALATDGVNFNELNDFLHPVLEDCIVLMKEYQHFPEIIEIILELFIDVVQMQLCIINRERSTHLLDQCLRLVQSYAKFNSGKKVSSTVTEEEQFTDLVLLIKLLTQTLSKDFIDVSDDAANGETQSSLVANTVICGLTFIIPMMSLELLKFPNLSNEYFKFAAFVCETYPEKIGQLPGDIYQAFVHTLELALSNSLVYNSDIAANTFDALKALASYGFTQEKVGQADELLKTTLKHFLKVVLELIVMTSFNFDLISSAADSLFCLICCSQMDYYYLVQSLIAEQTDSVIADRLREAFQMLTPSDLPLTPEKLNCTTFRKNLAVFLPKVKGFLCHK